MYVSLHVLLLVAFGNASLSDQFQKSTKNLSRLSSWLVQKSLETESKVESAVSRLQDAPFMCQGRLTLQTGAPIPTTDLANQSTLYFTPYQGNRIALYNGSNWVIYSFTERSLSLSGLTASTNYDVFIYNSGGTPTLELSAAWASATTRTDAITLQDGVYVKTTDTTRRYLGTFRATSATQTQDTAQQRFVWNYYNRVKRTLGMTEATDSWSYTTAAWQQVNASTNNYVQYVVGINEVLVTLRGLVISTGDGTNRTNISQAIGLDSTTTALTTGARGGGARNTIRQQIWSEHQEIANGLGYHALNWIEFGNTGYSIYGDDAGDARVQSGIVGFITG